MKRVAVYVRVSTLEQANEGYSIGAQKERLTAFCRAHDWLIHNFYVDGGFTGSNLNRPGIQKLIAEVEQFDMVLVYKLDRLSRSQKDTLHLIEEVFLPANVDFVSVNESFDTSTPFGRAMIGILSVFAQLEREQIRERTIMGRIARAKDGKRRGGGFDPIGYKKVGDTLEIIDYEATQVLRIYELYLSGKKIAQIPNILHKEGFTTRYGDWSDKTRTDGTVKHILTRPLYLGVLEFAGVRVENAHPPIIDQESFDKAQELIRKTTMVYGTSTPRQKHLLAGLVFCAHCGGRYFVRGYGKNRYYVCYSRNKAVKKMVRSDDCRNKNWKKADLEAIVSEKISTLIFDSEYFEKLEKKQKSKPKRKKYDTEISQKITSIEKQISRFMDLYGDSAIPIETISSRIEKLHHEKTVLLSELENAKKIDTVKRTPLSVTKELLADLSLVWEMASEEEKYQITRGLIERVVLDGDNVEIEWTFLL